MAQGKVWTADELLALSPNERYEIVSAGLVTELSQVPPELLGLARSDVYAHIAETEATNQPPR